MNKNELNFSSPVDKSKYKKVELKKWSPNFLIKTGVILNILFCALMSITIVGLPLTISGMVLNGLLLVPKVSVKRYWGLWRILPVAIVIFLTILIGVAFFALITGLSNVAEEIVNWFNTWIIFWSRQDDVVYDPTWIKAVEIVIFSFGVSGSILIILGWYKSKTIGYIEIIDKKALKKFKKMK